MGERDSSDSVKHALEALGPGHDDMAFGGCPFCKSIGSIGIASLAPPTRRDQCPVIGVGGEYAMEAGKIDARLGNDVQRAGR